MTDLVLHIHSSPSEIDATAWNDLLAQQPAPSPFMRHEYLAALHDSGSATPASGWTAAFVTLRRGGTLEAAAPVYVKDHSYGEYVFDWAWANAYEQHGLAYYPKAVVAVPFTPVPGTRLLARDAASRTLLVHGLVQWCEEAKLSSLHLLFGADEDIAACQEAGLMLRHTVQFHWENNAPTLGTGVSSLPPEGALPARGGPAPVVKALDSEGDLVAVLEGFSLLLRVLYPATPHIAHALWSELGYAKASGDLLDAPWPQVDPSALEQDEIELMLQVNGKLRGSVMVPAGASKEAIEALTLANETFVQFAAGAPIKRVIIVPGRLVNVVL